MTYYGGGGAGDFYNVSDYNNLPLMGKAGLGGGGGPTTNVKTRTSGISCDGKPNTGGGAASCYQGSPNGGSGIVVIAY